MYIALIAHAKKKMYDKMCYFINFITSLNIQNGGAFATSFVKLSPITILMHSLSALCLALIAPKMHLIDFRFFLR